MLSKRGKRIITINDNVYYWTTRRTIHREEASKNLYVEHKLFIEPELFPGRKLMVFFDSREFFPLFDRTKLTEFISITPAIVATVIDYAIAHGWQPEKSSSPFHIMDGHKRFKKIIEQAIEQREPTKYQWREWRK